MAKELEIVELDPATWGCAPKVDGPHSCLLNPRTGKMCCLGFAALQFGFQREDIENKFMPSNVGSIRDGERPFVERGVTHIHYLAEINDGSKYNGISTMDLSMGARVALLNECLEGQGATFRFALKPSA